MISLCTGAGPLGSLGLALLPLAALATKEEATARLRFRETKAKQRRMQNYRAPRCLLGWFLRHRELVDPPVDPARPHANGNPPKRIELHIT